MLGKAKPHKAGASADREDVVDLLTRVPFFDSLSSVELSQLKPFISVIEVASGELVFEEGDSGDYVCFIIEGLLSIYKTDSKGVRTPLANIPAGRCLGEMALVDRLARSATAVAAKPTCSVTLSRENFERACDKHPRMAIKVLLNIARLMSMNLRRTSAALMSSSQE